MACATCIWPLVCSVTIAQLSIYFLLTALYSYQTHYPVMRCALPRFRGRPHGHRTAPMDLAFAVVYCVTGTITVTSLLRYVRHLRPPSDQIPLFGASSRFCCLISSFQELRSVILRDIDLITLNGRLIQRGCPVKGFSDVTSGFQFTNAYHSSAKPAGKFI